MAIIGENYKVRLEKIAGKSLLLFASCHFLKLYLQKSYVETWMRERRAAHG
jgi:hypothetical protein